jgi:hypothetical protein
VGDREKMDKKSEKSSIGGKKKREKIRK